MREKKIVDKFGFVSFFNTYVGSFCVYWILDCRLNFLFLFIDYIYFSYDHQPFPCSVKQYQIKVFLRGEIAAVLNK